jgi:phosphatidylserine/phosphatidylglycerophosphate/cardiolipin synthase-like enzyme
MSAHEPGESAGIPVALRASYPLRKGNFVRPLVDGEPAFRRIGEAVLAARRSVFVTIAYVDREARLPDGMGSVFDLLERAAERGLDVRVLFWREPRLREIEPDSEHFEGSAGDLAWLRERGARFRARWDRLPDGFCQHQKSWLVDAGEAGETAFVGGINLDAPSIAAPGHALRGSPQIHDVYLELCGPSATDVHHNFVQRWNEASDRAEPGGAWPDARSAGPLEFPALISPAAGPVPVQLTRTVLAGRYRDESATPGGKPFPIFGGETSVVEQYLAAIAAARRSLYLENQAIGSPAVVEALDAALARGVEVVFLVPGNAHPAFVEARKQPRAAFFFEMLARLARHENFTLAAIAASHADGRYDEVYVHSKIALVDDAWCTIGSTNVAERSFHQDTELNASLWHAPSVRALRNQLLHEHLGRDVSELDDRDALRAFHEIARSNADRRARREPLAALAYAVDPAAYGGRDGVGDAA